MTSSLMPIVPFAFSAPTAMTYGSWAGLSSLPVPVPSLPADTTTTRPRCQACSAACASGSSRYDCVDGVPKDRLSTRMLKPGSSLCCTTQSMPAMTWLTSVAPYASATLTLTMRASGAMPEELARGGRCRVGPGVLARDDPGHVGAVPEGVQVAGAGRLRLEGQVRAVDDLARRGQALDRRDAAVDERDVDALAGQRLPLVAGTGDGADVVHRPGIADGVVGGQQLHRGVPRHLGHAGVGTQPGRHRRGRLDGDGVDEAEPARDRAAQLLDGRAGGRELPRRRTDDPALGRRGGGRGCG